jgi:bifunctional ADP-heptose synthase (sugar kinase/adenylyltransferase)
MKVDLSRVNQARVLVVGDIMLDRYWFGDVSRISPEAPGRRGQRCAQCRGAGRQNRIAGRGGQ